MNEEIFAYDFDGVISIGITPHSINDVIITGRCLEEKDIVNKYLHEHNINNKVYFNPMTLEERGNHTIESRLYSAQHKANTINNLLNNNENIVRVFEDDELQLEVLKSLIEKYIDFIKITSNLVIK